MFHGSIPAAMSSIISTATTGWPCRRIFVGCSGNFTIERCLHEAGRFELVGNDVTIYSSAIGHFLAAKPYPMGVREEYAEPYGWMSPYMETQAGALATLMLCSRMFLGFKSDNAYYARMRAAYREQWAAMHAKTLERLASVTVRLVDYLDEDVTTALDAQPSGVGVITFPPFVAGDYTKLFETLADVFTRPHVPTYGEINEAARAALFARVMEHEYWLFGTHIRREDLGDHLKGIAQTTNRGVPIYVYASLAKSRVVSPRQVTEPVLTPRLYPGEEIGERLTIHQLNHKQFSSLRSLYMNRHIRPGSALLAVAVCVDGKMVGVYAASPPSATSNWDAAIPGPSAYLLSDFPVRPTDYPRLAKLVLAAALSEESQALIGRALNRRMRSVVTTAFSNRPVSMKYRGLFRVLNRKERTEKELKKLGEDSGTAQKYMINYGADLGRWTLAEGLATWKQKHGLRQAAAGVEE